MWRVDWQPQPPRPTQLRNLSGMRVWTTCAELLRFIHTGCGTSRCGIVRHIASFFRIPQDAATQRNVPLHRIRCERIFTQPRRLDRESKPRLPVAAPRVGVAWPVIATVASTLRHHATISCSFGVFARHFFRRSSRLDASSGSAMSCSTDQWINALFIAFNDTVLRCHARVDTWPDYWLLLCNTVHQATYRRYSRLSLSCNLLSFICAVNSTCYCYLPAYTLTQRNRSRLRVYCINYSAKVTYTTLYSESCFDFCHQSDAIMTSSVR